MPPGARQQHQLNLLNAPSSDSEGASDAENSTMLGSNIKLSRVRFLALACLQVLIKSDPKAMHPLWPSLLPEIDTDLVSGDSLRRNIDTLILLHVCIQIYNIMIVFSYPKICRAQKQRCLPTKVELVVRL